MFEDVYLTTPVRLSEEKASRRCVDVWRIVPCREEGTASGRGLQGGKSGMNCVPKGGENPHMLQYGGYNFFSMLNCSYKMQFTKLDIR